VTNTPKLAMKTKIETEVRVNVPIAQNATPV
jgi:hypothetical protein